MPRLPARLLGAAGALYRFAMLFLISVVGLLAISVSNGAQEFAAEVSSKEDRGLLISALFSLDVSN